MGQHTETNPEDLFEQRMVGYNQTNNRIWEMIRVLKINIDNKENNQGKRTLNDIQLNYMISMTDIVIGAKFFYACTYQQDPSGLNYFARALTVSFCALFDNEKVLTQEKLKEYSKNKNTKKVCEEISVYLQVVEKIKKEHGDAGSRMREIRDKIGAHKDDSGYKQLKRIELSLNDMEYIKKTLESIYSNYLKVAFGLFQLGEII